MNKFRYNFIQSSAMVDRYKLRSHARFIKSALNRNDHNAAAIMLWTFIDIATVRIVESRWLYNGNFSDFPVANKSTVLNQFARNWQTVHTRFSFRLWEKRLLNNEKRKIENRNTSSTITFFDRQMQSMALSIIGLDGSTVYWGCLIG